MYSFTLEKEEIPINEALKEVLVSGIGAVDVINEIAKTLVIKRKIEELEVPSMTDEELDKAVDKFRSKMKLESSEVFSQWLIENEASVEELKWAFNCQGQISLLTNMVVSQSDIQSAYIKKRESLGNIRYSIIQVGDKSFIEKIYSDISKPMVSVDLMMKKYGSANYDTLNKGVSLLRSALKDVLLSMKPGAISKPFETEDGKWAIVILRELSVPELTNEIASLLQRELFNNWLISEMGKKEIKIKKAATALVH